MASDNDDDAVVRADRPRRLGRWDEREYDVPADDGRGQRRVVVIRRNEGAFGGPFERGGLFGGLFGGF